MKKSMKQVDGFGIAIPKVAFIAKKDDAYDVIVFQNHRQDNVILKFKHCAFDTVSRCMNGDTQYVSQEKDGWFLLKSSNSKLGAIAASAMWWWILQGDNFKVAIDTERYA